MIGYIGVGAAVASGLLGYDYLRMKGLTLKGLYNKAVAGGSAFAKLSELEGKAIALKAAAEAKKIEAKAIHDSLDEIDKLFG